jgi:hypothetical protein
MNNTQKTLTGIGLSIGLLILSSCAFSPLTSTNTPDLNPFRTEVAATVLAQITQTICYAPSSTPAPSFTPTIPTSTTPTLTASASATLLSTSSTGIPTAATTDRAEWVSQSITDGTIFAPGETFTITWQLKNVGTSTWTVSYLLRFYSGETFGAPNEILLGQVVLPQATVAISIPMKAPALPGDYRTDWVMSNESRNNFQEPIFLKITIVKPLTSTPSPAATLTLTPTP